MTWALGLLSYDGKEGRHRGSAPPNCRKQYRLRYLSTFMTPKGKTREAQWGVTLWDVPHAQGARQGGTLGLHSAAVLLLLVAELSVQGGVLDTCLRSRTVLLK